MPSHGPVIGGAIAKIDQYIAHRLDRERECIEALKQHEYLKDLVDQVYRDVPEKLRSGPQGGLAGLSLRAHLDKLKEGVTRFVEPDRWVRMPRRHPNPQSWLVLSQSRKDRRSLRLCEFALFAHRFIFSDRLLQF